MQKAPLNISRANSSVNVTPAQPTRFGTASKAEFQICLMLMASVDEDFKAAGPSLFTDHSSDTSRSCRKRVFHNTGTGATSIVGIDKLA
ncbi:hypothetical protein PoB_004023300 [Plakobranchus ocellatus]|uniref:Uncharacterized protein n=1 Tax=Plakobranchus ocellatus TaxID=259542 RepID=A0AAV4B3P1_9GAST|nr:hypothetical protein PoB_004023300 [Plakobranchus ocellatus]